MSMKRKNTMLLKRSAAVLAAMALVFSMYSVMPVGDKSDVANENSVTQLAKAYDETDEPEKQEAEPDDNGEEGNAPVMTEDKLDFEGIIKEISDEEYREAVDVEENSAVVMLDGERDIEAEEWFDELDIKSAELIYEGAQREDGSRPVSYKLTFEGDVWDTVDKINEREDILIAEPVYYYYTLEEGEPVGTNPEAYRQWYADDQKMSEIRRNTDVYGDVSGSGVTVAVIDTGVDYTHKDLQDNMWINSAELYGTEGVDDDNNGYVDDIYGLNLIDRSSGPMDDNGHGTHVAGIIAMSDNDIGGVGIAYNSKIMALKAGYSDGVLNTPDIVEAIEYAYKNGADVINMSFGNYAHSALLEEALQDAFASTVLVAAAGNEAIPTLDAVGFSKRGNMYPAAYSYVLGVMAYNSEGELASFSNWDFKPNYGAEYELCAPGEGIFSTLPGNRYASWSGTSMAAPVVSAAAAILRGRYEDKQEYNSRFIMGQLASATEDIVTYNPPFSLLKYEYSKLSILDSITKMPKPNINVDEVYIFDPPELSEKNNGDGIVQPGETIQFAIGLRNQWGAAKNVDLTMSSVSTGGVENKYVTYDNGNTLRIDDIGTFARQNNGFVYDEYGTVTSVKNPFTVTISETAPNDLRIPFYINFNANNALDDKDTAVYRQKDDTEYTIVVQSGVKLKGRITSDMTLTKNNYYIIENTLLISRGVTVNVDPGVSIQFWTSDSGSVYADTNVAYIQVEGKMNFNGTEEEPISIFPGKSYEGYRCYIAQKKNGVVNMNYVDILNPYLEINTGDHLSAKQDRDCVYYKDSSGYVYGSSADIRADKISNSKFSYLSGTFIGKYDTVLFDNCAASFNNDFKANDCTFLVNERRFEDVFSGCMVYGNTSAYDLGENFKQPSYEMVSSIYTLNGKKYALYNFDNYFYESGYWDNIKQMSVYNGDKNIKALENALKQNNGKLAVFNIYDPKYQKMTSDMMQEIVNEDEEYFGRNCAYLYTGIYYDKTLKKMTDLADGSVIDIPNYYGDPEYYIGTFYSSMQNKNVYDENDEMVYDEEGNPVIVRIPDLCYTNSINMETGKCYFVLAEYDESVDDDKIKNPVFDPVLLDIFENNSFRNNAILNRLSDTTTSSWMKLRSGYENNTYLVVDNNYWGTSDPKLIGKQVIDFDTNITYADYITDPFLTTPAESTYPCVSDVYLTDANGEKVRSVGSGKVYIHVLFNRDMDKGVSPMVTYGPDDPYTDYTFRGDWANSREWVGESDIKIRINQGRQYIRVKNAAAADDSWLTTGTDWGRFTFDIEASGAEALTLQGEGVKGAVYLNWVQDDFDTLAGYNIYRSETGDDYTFTKVNGAIIAPDSAEYYDRSVESGRKYYYYFTVVDTTLKESKPSNVISASSYDDKAPVIKHTPSAELSKGINTTITADITDNIEVKSAALYYRMKGSSTYSKLDMKRTNENYYSVQIPAKDMAEGTLEYYITATDGSNIGYAASESEPYTSAVVAKTIITSVECEGGKVGDEVSFTVNGMNLTEDVSVYVDSTKLDTQFVSDKELKVTGYKPAYMGKKNVSAYVGTKLINTVNNAFTVTDPSVSVTMRKTALLKNVREPQYIYYDSNFTGVVQSIEITYKQANYSDSYYPCINYNSVWSDYDGDEYWTATYQCYNSRAYGGNLIYSYFYNIDNDFTPEIKSIKINGVNVEKININKDDLTFIDSNLYVPVERIEFDQNEIRCEIGDTFDVNYSIFPENATLMGGVTYGYDQNMLKLNSDGTFTAIASGSVWISVNTSNMSSSVLVNINPVAVKKITTQNDYVKIPLGTSVNITFDVEPIESDAPLGFGYYSSEIISFTNIDNRGREYKIRGLMEGTTQIYTESNGNYCYVTVEVVSNDLTANIDQEILTLNKSGTAKLSAAVTDSSGAQDAEIVWSSNNEKVIKVADDGTVTAVGKGMAIITAAPVGSKNSDTIIIIVGSSGIKGDVNGDGKVTSTDAMLALKLSTADDCIADVKTAADVNGDGVITASDAMRILQYVTGAVAGF